MEYAVQQGNTLIPLAVLLVSSSDHRTGVIGATPAFSISKQAGLFHSPVGGWVEMGFGRYALLPNAADADTLGVLSVHAEADGADPTDADFFVVASDPTAAIEQMAAKIAGLGGTVIWAGPVSPWGPIRLRAGDAYIDAVLDSAIKVASDTWPDLSGASAIEFVGSDGRVWGSSSLQVAGDVQTVVTELTSAESAVLPIGQGDYVLRGVFGANRRELASNRLTVIEG